MSEFLHKVKEEVEKTLEAMEPVGGPEVSPELVRVAEAAGITEAGDDSASPAAAEDRKAE